MRVSKGAKLRAVKQAAFDAWKAKNPAMYEVWRSPMTLDPRVYQFNRLDYATYVSADWS